MKAANENVKNFINNWGNIVPKCIKLTIQHSSLKATYADCQVGTCQGRANKKKSRSGNFLQSREQLSLICSKQLFSVLLKLYALCSNFSFLFPAWSKGQIRSGHASRSCNTMLCYYSKTPQIAILIQDVLRMAPKCNNIFNAKCNNLSYIYSGRYSGR